MKNSRSLYQRYDDLVYTNDKFIYCSSIYKLWKGGAYLLEEKYYSSNKPLKLKKKDIKLKKKEYILYRFFDLEFAPETWLINNGFKIIEDNETRHS